MNKTRTFPVIKAFILALFIFSVNNFVKAQKDTVIIIGANKPIINDAFKINDYPQILDTTIEKPNVNYQIYPKLYPTSFAVDPIKPAKMLGQPITKLYRSYIKVGFGNKTTPLAEFNYSNLRSTNEAIGIYFNHLSSSGKINDAAYPAAAGFSDNEAGIYAERFYKNHTLSADINYNRNVVHYYGCFYPVVLNDFTKDSVKQRFAKVGGTFKYKSNFLDSSKVNHLFRLDYFHLSDLYNATEDYVGFKATIDKNIKLFGKAFKSQNLGLDVDVNYYNDANKSIDSSGSTECLLPHFSTKLDILRLYLGLNASFKTTEISQVFLYPDVNASINIVNENFVLYGGITGDLKRNNLMDIYAENPYINTTLTLEFTNTKSKYFGGFKGSISSWLSYDAYVSQSNIDNLPFYVADTSSLKLSRFTVIYEKTKVFNTHLEIAFQKSEKIKIMLSSDYYQYSIDYAWNKPDKNIKLSFDYNLKNKILLKVAVFAIDGCWAKIPEHGTRFTSQLKGTVDGNLGIEYRYNKILSAFLNFNNVGAVKYQQWYNYPTYGFNIMGGLTYAF